MPTDSPELTVNGVIQAYRAHADHLDFAGMLTRFQRDVWLGWKKHSRREAAVRDLALAQTLQQLGHLPAAARRFDRLHRRLDIPRSHLERFRDVLGMEAGDDALSLYYRLRRTPLGQEGCAGELAEAVSELVLPRNRSKFFWRAQVDRLATGRTVDPNEFEEQYRYLTDNASGAAMTNIYGIREYYYLFTGNYEGAIETAVTVRRAAEDIWRRQPAVPHLATHTVLNSLRQEIRVKRVLAMKRFRRNDDRRRQMRHFLTLAQNLCDDAGIIKNRYGYRECDGFRENDQLMQAFFEQEGSVEPDTVPSTDPAAEAYGILEYERDSMWDQLDTLCRWADAL